MNKTTILYAGMAALALTFAGCSDELPEIAEVVTPPAEVTEGTAPVLFTLDIPSGIQSRAKYSDGTKATTLSYALYDADGKQIEGIYGEGASFGSGTFVDLKTTVSLNLATGKTYSIVFWADVATGNVASPYNFDPTTGTITVTGSSATDVAGDPTGPSQDENRDAFFANYTFTVTGALKENITLTRPFSQINIATTDYADFTAAGGKISQTGMKVKGYKTINLLTGEVEGEKVDYTFSLADLPDATTETFPVSIDGTTFKYLTMDYILMGEDKEVVDIEWLTDGDNKDATVKFTQIPVQRNYRTNIYGALLTNPAEFTVEIKPEYGDKNDQDHNVNLGPWDGKTLAEPAYDEASNTFTVTSPAEFAGLITKLADPANSALLASNVAITNDIDLGGQTIPMIAAGATRSGGSASGTPFSGIFDGQGFHISNFTIAEDETNTSGGMATGFIASLTGTLRNVTFDKVEISSKVAEQTGLVALLSEGGKVENVNVTSGTITGVEGTGAIVGRILKKGSVTGCNNGADVVATAHNIGGIVGAAYYTNEGMTISDCHNTGNVTGQSVVGGVVGFSVGTVENCTNTGRVTSTQRGSLGGIVGEQQNSGSISGCTNDGDVLLRTTDTSIYGAGGIVGWIRYNGSNATYTKEMITVTNCRNNGSVEGQTGVAGIAGMIYTYGKVDNCINTAPHISASDRFASGLANFQVNEGSTIPDSNSGPDVIVTNNISTTPEEAITGACKDIYVYNNTPGALTQENNSTELPEEDEEDAPETPAE